MKILQRYLIGLLIGIIFISTASLRSKDNNDDAAMSAAEAWLELIDNDEFAMSWKNAGELFRNALTVEDWTQQMTAIRGRVGEKISRELTESIEETDPPNAPPGNYINYLFSSEFGILGSASEIVVVVDEEELGWRVIGYFVQPQN